MRKLVLLLTIIYGLSVFSSCAQKMQPVLPTEQEFHTQPVVYELPFEFQTSIDNSDDSIFVDLGLRSDVESTFDSLDVEFRDAGREVERSIGEECWLSPESKRYIRSMSIKSKGDHESIVVSAEWNTVFESWNRFEITVTADTKELCDTTLDQFSSLFRNDIWTHESNGYTDVDNRFSMYSGRVNYRENESFVSTFEIRYTPTQPMSSVEYESIVGSKPATWDIVFTGDNADVDFESLLIESMKDDEEYRVYRYERVENESIVEKVNMSFGRAIRNGTTKQITYEVEIEDDAVVGLDIDLLFQRDEQDDDACPIIVEGCEWFKELFEEEPDFSDILEYDYWTETKMIGCGDKTYPFDVIFDPQHGTGIAALIAFGHITNWDKVGR